LENPALITKIVAVELFWVLVRSYKLSRDEVYTTLESLLNAKGVVFEDSERVAQALEGYRDHRFDFADQMIALSAIAQRATHTVTFDLRAAKIYGMQLLG
jgi:predicted nucleic-acid-binding protein